MVTNKEREREKRKIGLWNEDTQATMYKIDKQQGYIVQYREI